MTDERTPQLDPKSEAQAIEASKTDVRAFTPLYKMYVRPIYRYLYSRTRRRTDAEDLTSQVFLEAIQSLPRYQHRGYFQAWLFSIAQHRVLNFYNRLPAVEEIDDTCEIQSNVENPLNALAKDDEIRELQQQFSALSPDEQEVLRLRFVAELTYAEIGKVLGRSEDAVKKQTYRILERLKSQLENEND
jgi:RNA polymerase sigma-70 factor (ECF subfamily)